MPPGITAFEYNAIGESVLQYIAIISYPALPVKKYIYSINTVCFFESRGIHVEEL